MRRGLLPGAQFCGAAATPWRRPRRPRLPPVNFLKPIGGRGIHIDADARGQGRGYAYEVLHQPSFALAVVRLGAEQSIKAEAGAMVSMSANVELQSQ